MADVRSPNEYGDGDTDAPLLCWDHRRSNVTLFISLPFFFFPFLAFLSPPFVKFLTSQLNMSLSTLVGSLAVIFILVG